MLASLSNRFLLNEHGHGLLAWRYYVKNTEGRRRSYADWLARVRPDLGDRAAAYRDLRHPPLFEMPEDDGAVAVPPDVIPGTAAAVAAADRLKAETQSRPSRRFLSELHLDAERLRSEPALLAYALNPGLIASVARYMGGLPVLYYVTVWVSEYAGETFGKSQLLHCDADDLRIASLFLYCSDVNEKSGPLTLIRAKDSQAMRDGLGYKYGGGGYRVSDADAAPYIKPDSEMTLTGPAGTLAAVDTARCFHQGSRVLKDGRPRVCAIFRYLTPNAYLWPARGGHRAGAAYRSLAGPDSSAFERLVLGAD